MLDPLERLLAQLLHYGTLAACGLIALGLALGVASGLLGMGIGMGMGIGTGTGIGTMGAGTIIATAGIALFILLPVLRVATMLVFFLRAGDYRYSAIAALVLLIISFSFFIGTR